MSNIVKIKIRSKDSPYWPDWFSIKKYDVFGTLTVEDYLNELDARLTLYHQSYWPNGKKHTDSRKLRQIKRGDVRFNKTTSAYGFKKIHTPSVIAVTDENLGVIHEIVQFTAEGRVDYHPRDSYITHLHPEKQQVLLSIWVGRITLPF